MPVEQFSPQELESFKQSVANQMEPTNKQLLQGSLTEKYDPAEYERFKAGTQTTADIIRKKARETEDVIYQTPGLGAAYSFLKPAVLPIGAMAATAPFTAGASAPVILATEAGASLLGESLNQLLGITEPSRFQLGLAATAPLTGRVLSAGVSRGGESLLKRLPGVAQVLREPMTQKALSMSGNYLPGTKADLLYNQLGKMNIHMQLPNTRVAVDELGAEIDSLLPGFKVSDLRATLEGARDRWLGGEKGMLGVDLATMRNNYKAINAKIKSLGLEGGEALGAYKKLKGALLTDLEEAATQGEYPSQVKALFDAANKSAKREFATEELTNLIERNTKVISGLGDIRDTNTKGVLDGLDKLVREDQWFKSSFSEQEHKEIRDFFVRFNEYPKITSGLQMGAGSLMARGLLGGLGVGLMEGATGGAAGPMLDTMAGMGGLLIPEMLAPLITTKLGRSAILGIMSKAPVGIIDRQKAAYLAQFLRSQSAEEAMSNEELVTKLQGPEMSFEDKVMLAREKTRVKQRLKEQLSTAGQPIPGVQSESITTNAPISRKQP